MQQVRVILILTQVDHLLFLIVAHLESRTLDIISLEREADLENELYRTHYKEILE
jgi:hypothetical protein